MLKLLRNTPGRITAEFYDAGGALVSPNPVPTVTVVDGAGTAIVTAQNAVNSGSAGLFQFDLTPAQLVNLDIYTATWTGTIGGNVSSVITEFEVAGGYLFSVNDLQKYDQAVATAAAPDIIDKRNTVEERFEAELGTALVPRGRRWTLSGDYYDSKTIVVTDPVNLRPITRIRKVNAVTVDGTALTSAGLLDLVVDPLSGRISRKTGWWTFGFQNIVVYLEFGYDQAPKPLRDAGLEYCKRLLLWSNDDERMVNAQSELDTRGPVNLTIPSRWRPTGIPSIDSVLWRYSDRAPGIA